MTPFFTIGHATRPLEDFIALLAENEVARLADVRSFPRSRTNPQFNIESLPAALAKEGIAYRHFPSLGGKRPRRKDIPEDTNAFWDNAGFHNYSDWAMGDEFRAGFEELLRFGDAGRAAVMCAETLWWRCHRRIVADYLLAADRDVWHILGHGAVEPARITPAARPGPHGAIVYPFTLS
jgi:uncharacterized protein (DUF488 family)